MQTLSTNKVDNEHVMRPGGRKLPRIPIGTPPFEAKFDSPTGPQPGRGIQLRYSAFFARALALAVYSRTRRFAHSLQ